MTLREGETFTMDWPRKWWQFWKPRYERHTMRMVRSETGIPDPRVWEHFDRAFGHMDKAFSEMDQAFRSAK